MTSRRAFLSALMAGAVLDPEKLLWRPGAKMISIPKQRTLYVWNATTRPLFPYRAGAPCNGYCWDSTMHHIRSFYQDPTFYPVPREGNRRMYEELG